MQETLGSRIRTLREAKGLTQTQLGEAVGVTKTTVSAWETGYAENIRLTTLYALLEVLGTSLGYLLFGAEKRPAPGAATGVVRRRRGAPPN